MMLSGIGSNNHTGLNDRRNKDMIKQALNVEFGPDEVGQFNSCLIIANFMLV